MKNQTPSLQFLILLIFTANLVGPFNGIPRLAEAGKRRVHITDDLDDVVDDEEDEAWREWGKKSTPPSKFDPPPLDFSDKEMPQLQAEMLKRQFGPVFGFIKLRLDLPRTPETVSEIAMKWTKLSRTGSIETQFMGFDLNTVMFTMEKGQDSIELKEFVLNQPEAYEIKIGDQVFRRPGDPPLEEEVVKLRQERSKADETRLKGDNEHRKDEL
ncbi:uncharacterized protein LOC127801632 [Diospyros lotus]|uniref:uncharacterized protein LOC127801632 n=1 Tax=Diospyros lotus TaxID=55363 RepID=UPI00225BAF89|nr:uncharacterized protein LOC127801632 [Diospyros lotus]